MARKKFFKFRLRRKQKKQLALVLTIGFCILSGFLLFLLLRPSPAVPPGPVAAKSSAGHFFKMSGRPKVVFVIDDEPPVITPKTDLTFDVFSPTLHLSTLFDIEDNYYDSGELTLKISAQIDMDIIGSYPITVESKDPSGNVFYYRDYIPKSIAA
ncbi:MAG: hypothetical protein EOM12_16825, partial [Verrucomicrobiae bacterium]|nr:hypothetical protein [Verrucomicrobiae bacterium]